MLMTALLAAVWERRTSALLVLSMVSLDGVWLFYVRLTFMQRTVFFSVVRLGSHFCLRRRG